MPYRTWPVPKARLSVSRMFMQRRYRGGDLFDPFDLFRIRTPFRPQISDLPFTSPPLPWPALRRRYGPVLARLASFAFAFHGNAQDAVQAPGLSSRRPSMDRRGLRPLRSFSNTTHRTSTLQYVTNRWNICPEFRRDSPRNIYATSISRRRRRHGF